MATPITLSMDGTMLNWLKKVGDAVKQGEVIAEIESDKATVEVEAPADGVLLQTDAQPGDSLTSGAVLGTIGAPNEQPMPVGERQEQQPLPPRGERLDTPPPQGVTDQEQASSVITGAQHTPTATQPLPPGQPAAQPQAAAQAPSTQPPQTSDIQAQRARPVDRDAVPEGNGHFPGGVKASPLARRIAEERGIDLRQVKGSGPGGRIVKEDVENFKPAAPAPAVAPAPATAPTAIPAGLPAIPARKLPEGPDVEIVDVSTMRRRIAAGTMESNLTTPTFFVTVEMDMAALLALRKQLNDSLPEGATKISVNDLIVKAVALALRQFPNLNSHYYGDKLARHKRINIGIAVAVPQGGVIYVVARDADKMALGALADLNKQMVARAREGKLKPDDIGGATFSISNLGPFDVEHFTAIINPPEAGVLAVGAAKPVPVVQPDGSLGVGNRMRVTLSVDHRVSDGAEGAQFLQAVRQLIENPMRLLI
ncbi:MAG: 2-oxo acid dehydrogenase subunit E2 [Chloroflexi bacterium]|nr:2-oxo acid dehydrogenase subunit E2 [Chloroflexota bacterium]